MFIIGNTIPTKKGKESTTMAEYDVIEDQEVLKLISKVRKFPEFQDTFVARIAYLWKFGINPDVDGRLQLGLIQLENAQRRLLYNRDAMLVLNGDVWPSLNDTQKEALIYHEFCHLRPRLDKEGDLKTDARGFQMFRLAKHTIEEFHDVTAKYGIWKNDIETFAKTLLTKKDEENKEESEDFDEGED